MGTLPRDTLSSDRDALSPDTLPAGSDALSSDEAGSDAPSLDARSAGTLAADSEPPASFSEINVPTKGTLLHGKYRVEGVIGIGGMGLVIAARHELLKTRVALKMRLPAFAQNHGVRVRFEREAQAAFSHKSEHVCRVLEPGSSRTASSSSRWNT